MKHIISVIVDNKPRVLARVAALFGRRNYNIDSLAVGPAESKDISRMTIVIHGDDKVLEQITKQLNKLADVKKIIDLTSSSHVEREIVLIKINYNKNTRGEIMDIVKTFRAKIIDIGENSFIVELTGDADKNNALIDLLDRFGIMEIVRSGKIGILRKKYIYCLFHHFWLIFFHF
jgi:acetolactate synthase-1/3 small subunit